MNILKNSPSSVVVSEKFHCSHSVSATFLYCSPIARPSASVQRITSTSIFCEQFVDVMQMDCTTPIDSKTSIFVCEKLTEQSSTTDAEKYVM